MVFIKDLLSSITTIFKGTKKRKSRATRPQKPTVKRRRKNITRKTRSAKSYKKKKSKTPKKTKKRKIVKKKVKRVKKKTAKRKKPKAARPKRTVKKSKPKKKSALKTKKVKKPKKKKAKTKPGPKKPKKEGILVGKITHYFNKISVCVIKVTGDRIEVGDVIRIDGPTRSFAQAVKSIQIESVDVKKGKKGQLIGLKTQKPAKEGDKVYRL